MDDEYTSSDGSQAALAEDPARWEDPCHRRRKESVARVFLKPNGEGKVIINGQPAEQYFAADGFIKDRITQVILKPFVVTGTMNRYDVIATCRGGGFTDRWRAIRLGDRAGTVGSQSGLPDSLAQGRAAHARPAHGRAQEVRLPQSAARPAIQQALIELSEEGAYESWYSPGIEACGHPLRVRRGV
jgi:ribosomal protein S9